MNSYILTHSLCSSCVWGENGYYNAICAHCPYCQYGKKEEPCWMSRETAETLGIVKRSELITGKENSND